MNKFKPALLGGLIIGSSLSRFQLLTTAVVSGVLAAVV